MDDWLDAFEPDRSEYDKVCLKSKELNEQKDCSVISVAIACDIEYMEAHKVLARLGRKAGHGCNLRIMERAIKTLGFQFTRKAIRQANDSKYTPLTIETALPKGRYICDCAGHVFAVVNGVVQDWSSDNRLHIKSVYKIEKLED